LTARGPLLKVPLLPFRIARLREQGNKLMIDAFAKLSLMLQRSLFVGVGITNPIQEAP
jgi:hypothetical protein